ncbi:pyridoxal phosphate-dependent aminotransferase [Limibaculum sp. M0105]|uniref:Aminotransferase n=1 Tax=Thermohalobaculum xanthum TaxID=2753746 RepID=A0A8J7SHL0_9RHOB|nr:pyridoxal phosphate-dependent aminotransferase [Thermohalobaculum xanthum]MBK0400827.1 pyridoxal phosphate-dependent aminotransferase [Thermohalobaculum xanthum]
MAQLSQRISGIVGQGGDDGWSVYYRARELAEAGHPIVMLTVGDHDIKTDPAILDAMRDSQQRGDLGYPPVTGSAALRRAIAERVSARTMHPARPAEVQVVPGGQAGLFAALVATLDPGQSCVVLDPYYATYVQTVRAAGGRAIVVPTDAEDGFQPEAARIEAALAPDTRAILLNTPNNPTGAVYAPDLLEAIADLCRRRDLWLISDEVYDVQVHVGRHASPRDLPGMAGRTLVVNSLSKSHAMTGSRIGWVLGPEDAIARMGELATTTTYGVPGFIQDAAVFALTQGAQIEEAIALRYRRRRDAVLESLGNARAVRANAPAGGMYVMLDIRPTGLSGLDFAHRLLDAEGIAVMPGESFGTAAAGHLRVALTRPEAVLRDALGRLVDFARRIAA